LANSLSHLHVINCSGRYVRRSSYLPSVVVKSLSFQQEKEKPLQHHVCLNNVTSVLCHRKFRIKFHTDMLYTLWHHFWFSLYKRTYAFFQ